MKSLHKSLSGRLMITAIAVIIISLICTGAAMNFTLHRFIQGQIDGRLDGQIASVRAALTALPTGSLKLEHGVDGPPFDRPRSGWYWKIAGSGDNLKSASLQNDDFTFDSLPPDDPPHPVTVEGLGPPHDPLRVRAKRFVIGGNAVIIAASAPLYALTGPLRNAMIPVVACLTLLGFMLGAGALLQVRLGLRPLSILRRDLAQVQNGAASRIDRPQPVEIAPLVADLNTLLEQNAANLERARRHVSNLAHGLKTPLAALSLALNEPGADKDGTLKPMIAAMDRLIRHHLSRARMAALGGKSRARVNLAEKISDHIAVFSKLYADKNLYFTTDLTATLAIACETQDIDEILGNLLDNACKWAFKNITIKTVDEGSFAILTIIDDGLGIPDDQIAKILQPGQRLDESAPGYGFGLAITRELVELNGGSLQIKRADKIGFQAIVKLPRQR